MTGPGLVGFYVTVVRDPGPRQKVGWLLGPYDTKEAAECDVVWARNKANEIDPFTAFDVFGVTKLTRPGANGLPIGKLGTKADPFWTRKLSA
jgi:hypothetical protein